MQNDHTEKQGQNPPADNHLSTAEMAIEDNYNNIDGIIGNAPKKDSTEEHKSLNDRLEHFKTIADQNAIPPEDQTRYREGARCVHNHR